MTIFDMPNYLWITIVAMIILTVFCALVLKKWFVSAVITFVALAVLAFFIPNFYDISFQPLLGYAAFLAIISLIISFYYGISLEIGVANVKETTRKIRKYEDDDETIRRLRR